MMRACRWAAAAAFVCVAAACSNNPYPAELMASNTLVYTFDERSPRYLDPVASYSNPESAYTYQIYEAPYSYHYLKRPYELIPKLATQVVAPVFIDANGQRLPDDAPADRVAESVYDIPIRHGVMYQPHPALAKDAQGRYRYHTDHALTRAELGDRRSPWDFEQGTRELVAEDFVYGLKRHATTRIEAPVYAVFAEYVIGLKDYAELIKREDAKLLAGLPEDLQDKPFLDFRRWPLAGAQAVDRYTLRMRLKGKYPQWRYWMAMPFTVAVALGGRRVLRAARHGRGGAVAEPMADRHRPVHDAHLRARPTARARAQPPLPRRHLSVRRAAR